MVQDGILIVDDLEKIKINELKTIKSIEDLVLVHVTNFCPSGKILSSRETGRIFNNSIIFNSIDGKKYNAEINRKEFRNSVHFCLNGTVESHAFGNWDNKEFAILIPLKNAEDKILAGKECDLFTNGGVELDNNCYILCPKNKIEYVKSMNPNVNVIGYEPQIINGKNLTIQDYANYFLTNFLGYKYKEPSNSSKSWKEGEDKTFVENFIKEKWEYIDHNGSKYSDKDEFLGYLDLIINYIKLIQKNNFLLEDNWKQSTIKILNQIINCQGLKTFSFISYLRNQKDDDLNMEVFKLIEKETKIKINTEILNKTYNCYNWYETMANDISNEIFNKLILQKLKTEANLQDKKSFCLDVERKYGSFEKSFEDKYITEEDLKSFDKIEILKNKKIDELTQQELNIVLYNLSLRLNYMFDDLKLNVQYKQEVTEEESLKYKEASDFKYPIKAGIYLVLTNYKEIFKENIYNQKRKLLSGEISLYECSKNIKSNSEYHLIDTGILDYDFSNCHTVKELINQVIFRASEYNDLIRKSGIITNENKSKKI